MNIKNLIKGNIGFIAAMAFLLLMVFNPSAKAWVLSGLMKAGLFQPDVKANEPGQPAKMLPEGIVLSDKTGRPLALSGLKGKVLFINFWATWCPPCIAEMPSINKLYQQFEQNSDLVFLMVDVDNSLQRSLAFMEQKNYSLPVYTPASAIPPDIFDGSIPTTLIVNKAGEIVFEHTGGADFSNGELVQFLRDLTK